MSGLWQGAADGDWLTPAPDRDDLAVSMAHKIMLVIAIVGLIVGLWALTSPQAAEQTDATLGPPLGRIQTVDGQQGGGQQAARN